MLNRLTNLQLLYILVVLLTGIAIVKLIDKSSFDYASRNAYYPIDAKKLHFFTAIDSPQRHHEVVNSDANTWSRIEYLYPSNASYMVERNGNSFVIGGKLTDSIRSWYFLRQLQTVNATAFIDGVSPYQLVQPDYQLRLFTNKTDSIAVACYVRSGLWLITSSQSPGNVFDGLKDSLFEKVFVGKSRFFPKK